MDADKSPFQNFDVLKVPTITDAFKWLGRGIVRFCSMELLSPHSDHFLEAQEHPLDRLDGKTD